MFNPQPPSAGLGGERSLSFAKTPLKPLDVAALQEVRGCSAGVFSAELPVAQEMLFSDLQFGVLVAHFPVALVESLPFTGCQRC